MPIYEDLGVALRLVFSDSPDYCEHRYHLNKQSHSMKAHQNHSSCCTSTQCERKEASPVCTVQKHFVDAKNAFFICHLMQCTLYTKYHPSLPSTLVSVCIRSLKTPTPRLGLPTLGLLKIQTREVQIPNNWSPPGACLYSTSWTISWTEVISGRNSGYICSTGHHF